mgnify:CR=1 FL=1
MKFFYKDIGITSNELIYQLKKKGLISRKACYCGRLDPMARGKMLILQDDECKKMGDYLGNNKTYEFEIIYDYSTDTDDIMGILEENSENKLCDIGELKNALIRYTMIRQQKFHKYSSFVLRKNDMRKPLWEWEKLGLLEDSEIPEKYLSIIDIYIYYKQFKFRNI